MSGERAGDLETDSRLPSGEWAGFFVQPDSPRRHWMLFYLEFRGGQMRGEGNDWVGPFHLSGEYDAASGECRWIKQYLGRHLVLYRGLCGEQGIVGTWNIPGVWSDAFHIWPKGWSHLEQLYLEAESSEWPVDARSPAMRNAGRG